MFLCEQERLAYTIQTNAQLDTTYWNIFDRWGDLVFNREEFLLDSFEGWDGMFGNRQLKPGVYIYFADISLDDGMRMRLRGDVTLVR